METEDVNSPLEPRPPTLEDLLANLELLWRTKQTLRDKDQLDWTFLAELLRKSGKPI